MSEGGFHNPFARLCHTQMASDESFHYPKLLLSLCNPDVILAVDLAPPALEIHSTTNSLFFAILSCDASDIAWPPDNLLRVLVSLSCLTVTVVKYLLVPHGLLLTCYPVRMLFAYFFPTPLSTVCHLLKHCIHSQVSVLTNCS